MCDCQRTDDRAHHPVALTRRALIAGSVALGLAACGARPPDAAASAAVALPPVGGQPLAVASGLTIHPRDDWAIGRPPKGVIASEEVKFLLVHHTASSNDVPDPRLVMQQTYDFHTSAAKGWPDVCYHFFVAPDGSVWEGRAGSLAGPVVADATGGNQGYAQLVCLLGDFSNQPPTPAAQDSLMRTLLWLADRYGVDTDPEATVTFTSRGSDKFRRGSTITTSTISGHRDVTYTSCPGDDGYRQLATWRSRVHATRLMRTDAGPTKRAVRLGVHLT